MKHIKKDFSPKVWVQRPRGGGRPKFNFFQNMVMLHIKLKGMTHAAS